MQTDFTVRALPRKRFDGSTSNPCFPARIAILVAAGLLLLSGTKLHADNEWQGSTSDWNTASNWSLDTVPNGSGQVAGLYGEGTPTIDIGSTTSVDTIEMGFRTYYTIIPGYSFTLTGAGVTGFGVITFDTFGPFGGTLSFTNSASAEFSVINNAGLTKFSNTATASSAEINNSIEPEDIDNLSDSGSETLFENASSAGNSTIVNFGLLYGSPGCVTDFTDSATAANANVTNSPGAAGDSGATSFAGSATAGSAQITNVGGGTTSYGADMYSDGAVFNGGLYGGTTDFSGNATAANGKFHEEGGIVAGATGGSVNFTSSSTAANATFTLDGGTLNGAGGGTATFADTTTAGSAVFTVNGGSVQGASGGSVTFENQAKAGAAAFTANGGTASGAGGATIDFTDISSAGSATLIANGGTNGGEGATIDFANSSTGGLSTVKVYGNGALDMSSHATDTVGAIGSLEGTGNVFLGANNLSVGQLGHSTVFSGVISDGGSGGSLTKVGNGILTLSGANTYTGPTTITYGTLLVDGSIMSNSTVASSGVLEYGDASNAGSATIISNPGTFDGSEGGIVVFEQNSSAGSANITLNGGSSNGAAGGPLYFEDNSSAGSATLIANAGTMGGVGGTISFLDDSTGGTGPVKVYGNGSLDISSHNSGMVAIGSLEGSGIVSLGANTLSVGGNNASTVFSGTMSDGGAGGSLIKTGSGLLRFNTGTYTGSTTIAGGAMEVDGSLASNLTIDSGTTLAGTGSLSNITLMSGGFLAPGSYGSHTANTLTAKSLLWEGGGTLNFDIGGPVSDYLILSGALDTDSADKGPFTFNFDESGSHIGQTFDLIGFTSEDIPLADFVSEAGDNVSGVFSYNNDELQFTVQAAPEPSTWALLLACSFGLILAKRKTSSVNPHRIAGSR